jgi:hypothetical protein
MAEASRPKPRKATASKRAAKATPAVDLLDVPATGVDRMSVLPERAAAEQLSGGLDTSVFANAWADYWAKLLNSPARQAALATREVARRRAAARPPASSLQPPPRGSRKRGAPSAPR